MLDMDGVMNSYQSSYWYRYMLGHEEESWVNYKVSDEEEEEFSAYVLELCPLACSNLKLLLDRHPDARIVISSTWRRGAKRTPDWFNRLFRKFKIIKEDRVIDKTPELATERGYEIQDWLSKFEGTVEEFVILDDDSDMGPYCDTHHFVQTSSRTGFDYFKMEEVDKIFGGFVLNFEDVEIGKKYKMYGKPRDTNYFKNGEGMSYYQEDGSISNNVYLPKGELFAEVKDV